MSPTGVDGLDHLALRTLGVPRYIRYMDDAVLFGRSRTQVAEWVEICRRWLRDARGLMIHAERARPRPTRQGHRFLGYTVWPGRWQVSGRTLRRAAARLKARARSDDGVDADALARDLRARIGALIL